MSKRLVLIDGNSVIYRAFYALPLLHNDKGVYTNAVYGFTTMLLKILEEEQPTHMLVAFDAGKTTFRHETYGDYKGGRQKTPPELSEQFPVLKELLNVFNIAHYELPLYEADDIIGTLATQGGKAGYDVKVISGDQDLLQLVAQNVTVDVTKKGISEVESYTPEFLKEKMEITSEQIIDLKALMGDSSDNIPGVPGIGIKTATKLIKEYGSLENIYQHIEDITAKKMKENLLKYKDEAFMSKQLVTINRETPVEVSIEDLTYAGYDEAKLAAIFNELGFQSLLKRLDLTVESENDLKEIHYERLDHFPENHFQGAHALMIEMMEENYHEAPILGFSIANNSKVYYLDPEDALTSVAFKKWLEDPKQEKYVFDAKAAFVALKNNGIHLQGVTFDAMLGAYVLNPAGKHETVADVATSMNIPAPMTDEEVYGKGAKQKLPEKSVFMEHVTRKAYALYQLTDVIQQQLQEQDQLQLFKDIELPLAFVLGEMEHRGVLIDEQSLQEMGKRLHEQLTALENKIYDLAGESFNINSPKQLGIILFERLKLPVIKKTKTGYSTAADVLEKLQDKHEIIPTILDYRQLGKLQSTYIEGLLKVVHPETKKIHTRFNQALTQTGRLSSVEPNLQNIPIRLEEGRKIREAFVPSKNDWKIFAADYSQIELRVLAHMSEDDRLIDAFNNDSDVHTETAQVVFNVSAEQVTPLMRSHAKAVNFGIVYGMSDYGLSQNLNITRKEAKQFIDQYFKSFPGVKEYMDETIQEAKHKGYVTTYMNRRRYLPEITSRNFNQRSFAERMAMNTPIQGSAADIIKKAMLDLSDRLKREKLQARMLLQVHDELILEAPTEEIDILLNIVPEVMESTVQLNVPLKVNCSYGDSWFHAN